MSIELNNIEIIIKTVVDGRVTEVIVHILDEDDMEKATSDKEVTA